MTLLTCVSIGVSASGLCVATLLGGDSAAVNCEKVCTQADCPMHRHLSGGTRTPDVIPGAAFSTPDCRLHDAGTPAKLALLVPTVGSLPPTIFEPARVERTSPLAPTPSAHYSVSGSIDPRPPRSA